MGFYVDTIVKLHIGLSIIKKKKEVRFLWVEMVAYILLNNI